MRALAKRLSVSPSFLSRMMSGKKPIPAGMLNKLAKALDIEPEFLGNEPRRPRRKSAHVANSQVEEYELTAKESEQVLRNWYFIAILELTTLKDFDGSIEMIADRLNISQVTAEIALRELQSYGLVENKNGRLVKAKEKIRFASATSTHNIRKFHDDLLEQAQILLRKNGDDEEFQRRLITGLTLTCTPEAVQDAKRKLSECLFEIANDLSASPGTEVYHLAAQLFPLTKR